MRQKKQLIFYVTFLFVLLMISCNNQSNDEFDIDNSNAKLVNDKFVSKEFKEYKSNYAKFDLVIKQILKKASREDVEEIANLYFEYIDNPTDYKELLEYKVLDLVGQNSKILEEMYQDLMIQKEKLISKESFVLLSEEDRLLLSTQLIVVNKESLNDIPRTKTLSENNDCIRRCAEQRDLDIKAANMVAACATAVNTAACLATAGATSLMWWISEFGIAAARDIAVYYAHENYDICVRGC